MKVTFTEKLSENEKHQILALWNKEYPAVIKLNSLKEFENYVSSIHDHKHILLKSESEEVKGWYVDFIRDGKRWFVIIIDSEIQGKGYGKLLLSKGKERNSELNGWVINSSDFKKENGEIYQSPVGFYVKNGFKIFPNIRFETDILTTIKIKWKR